MHSSAPSVPLRSNPIETGRIATHLGHRRLQSLRLRLFQGSRESLTSYAGQLTAIPVAFAAIPAILALDWSWISAIRAVAFQALTVLPAEAGRIILASLRFGLADLTVF